MTDSEQRIEADANGYLYYPEPSKASLLFKSSLQYFFRWVNPCLFAILLYFGPADSLSFLIGTLAAVTGFGLGLGQPSLRSSAS